MDLSEGNYLQSLISHICPLNILVNAVPCVFFIGAGAIAIRTYRTVISLSHQTYFLLVSIYRPLE